MLQEYQYGYYPDRSLETVTATRSGKSLTVTVTLGSTKANIAATVSLPTSATKATPVGVVIAIGGIDNNAFLNKEMAVVTFDYSSVAADSNSKTGSFWTLYKGKYAGMALQSDVRQASAHSDGSKELFSPGHGVSTGS